jgi:uncharacterized protein (UPF0371 family)
LYREVQVFRSGFDCGKYLEAQKKAILDRIGSVEGRLYLEFGGKLLYDYHAARVLPGYDPNAKLRLLHELSDNAEILVCIHAGDIERRRLRGDFGITYDVDALKLIDELRSNGLQVSSVVVTRYTGQPAAESFMKGLSRRGVKVCAHPPTRGYPSDVDRIASEEGYGRNPYIPCTKPLVIVTGPGPGSGKLATSLSQIYHEHMLGCQAGYAKFESFPVWNLPLDHPVNAAYEAATADIDDFNMIDPFHLEATGIQAVNYNRDVEAFPLLQRIYEKITGRTILYSSPTEMGVNRIADGITDDGAIREAAEQELIRRYFRYRCEYMTGLVENTTVAKAESLLSQYGLTPEKRSVVIPAREEKATAAGPAPQGAALELPDGTIVRGRTSSLMTASSALVLNASKVLAGLPREMNLLSPGTISSIARLKSSVLGTNSPELDLEEVLIALSVSAMTSPAADLAMKTLSMFRNCDAHLTSLPRSGDGSGLRKLGINVTSDPGYPSGNLWVGLTG